MASSVAPIESPALDAPADFALLRQRIAQAMNRLGLGAENPRLIEAHIRYATAPTRLDGLKMLELERLVYDAREELLYRPELVPVYTDRAAQLFEIPPFAYVATELGDPRNWPPITAGRRVVE